MRTYNRRFRYLDMIDAMLNVNFNNIERWEEVESQLKLQIPDEVHPFAMKNLYRRQRGGQFAWRLNL